MGVLSWDWHEREIRVDVRPRGWEALGQAAPRCDLSTMTWTLSDAAAFVADIHDELAGEGYGVGIYGSVARGELGNDLDLVIWASDGREPDPSRVLSTLLAHGCWQTDAYGGGPELYLKLERGGQKVHVRILTGSPEVAQQRPSWMSGPLRPLIDW